MTVLHPRDARCVSGLRNLGITLLEVTIPPLSNLAGMAANQISWPEDTRLLCVARGGQTVMDLAALSLAEGDVLYLMCRDVRAVRQTLELDR